MNKKLKKLLASLSAIAVCAVSATSIFANAKAVLVNGYSEPGTLPHYIEDDIVCYYEFPVDTKAFYCGDAKFVLNEAATEYMKRGTTFSDIIIYISEEKVRNGKYEILAYIKSHPYNIKGKKSCKWEIGLADPFLIDHDEEETNIITEYLDSQNIKYSLYSTDYDTFSILLEEDEDKYFPICRDIFKNTGIPILGMVYPESVVSVDSIEIELPAPTLAGDANEDGEVSLADAVFIMQALSNPDEFQLTPQGMANADIYGESDGITAMDALKIQEMLIEL